MPPKKGLKRPAPEDSDEYEDEIDTTSKTAEKATGGKATKFKSRDRKVEKTSESGGVSRTTRRSVNKDFTTIDNDHDLLFAALISPLLESNDPLLKNTRRLARLMQDIKLRRFVAPVVPKTDEIKLKSLLDSSASVPGKRVHTGNLSKSHSSSSWMFYFKDQGTTKAFVSKTPCIKVAYHVIPENTSEAFMAQVHTELANYHERYPWIAGKSGPFISVDLIGMILSNLNSRPVEITDVFPSPTKASYGIAISYFDSATGERGLINTHASASKVATQSIFVPDLPDILVKRQRGPTVLTNSSQPHYENAPSAWKKVETSIKAQHLAIDALRYLAFTLNGMVSTKARMEELINVHRGLVGLKRGINSGLYGGESGLYAIVTSHRDRKIMIKPSNKIEKDMGIGNTKLWLIVNSMLANRATPILEAFIQIYCSGRDIRYALIKAARIADQVNIAINEGIPPSSQCDCDDEQAKVELHPCEGCGQPVRCSERAVDSLSRLVDRKCHARDKSGHVPGPWAKEPLAAYKVRRSLRTGFRIECRTRGFNPFASEFESILEEANSGLSSALIQDKPTVYIDSYTGKTHDIGGEHQVLGNNPSRRRYFPDLLCVDAVYPVGAPGHKSLKHSPGNVVVTSCAANMAKGRFLPGALQEVVDFCRNPTPAQRKHLLAAIESLTTVLLKLRFTTAFVKKGTAQSRYNKLKAEMISGKPTKDEHGPWEKRVQKAFNKRQYPVRKGKNIWSEETFSRLQACAQEISDWSGVALFELEDGTLWVGDEDTNRTDLNRNGIAILCQERLQVMTVACNKKWETDETDESLYMEWVFQFCASHTTKPDLKGFKDMYGDRFGLPLTLGMNSPLRTSISHRLHGFQMVSGWDRHPSNLQQRLDNDSANNMLFESWFVNSCKFDMAEERYEEMDAIILSIQVPKRFYDPDKPAPHGDATFFGDATFLAEAGDELELPDDYDGATFNADDVSGEDQEDEGGAETSGELGDVGGDEHVGGAAESGGAGDVGDGDQEDDGFPAAPADESVQDFIDDIRHEIVNHEFYRQKFAKDPEIPRLLGKAQQLMDDGQYQEAKNMGDLITQVLEEGRTGHL